MFCSEIKRKYLRTERLKNSGNPNRLRQSNHLHFYELGFCSCLSPLFLPTPVPSLLLLSPHLLRTHPGVLY